MINYTLLEKIEDSFYFNNSDKIILLKNKFPNKTKELFESEIKKCLKNNKTAGYSKSKQCYYLSLIIVTHHFVDGELYKYDIKHTYLIDKDQKITDVNNNIDNIGFIGNFNESVYHVLPDGEILEYKIQESYEKELNQIYNTFSKLHEYHNLIKTLPEKLDVKIHKKNKI